MDTEKVQAGKAGLHIGALRRLRHAVAAVGRDVTGDTASLFDGLAPEPYAHPFK